MSMKLENVNAWTRCALLTLALSLAGCGGGGESGGASAGSGGVSAAMKSDTSGQITSTPLQAPGIDDDSGLTAQQATSPALDLSSVVPRLNAGDPRNGVYYVYSADGSNGTRQKLGINFDTKSYSLVNSKGSATSGTFSEDPVEPGTYVFASSRITSAVNTARFRITTDAIVGAFPFEKPWSDPVAYEVTPFVAARTFVTAPALLDGDYNRYGISRNSDGSSDSQILPMRISGQGTLLEMCFDFVIYRVESCPPASKRSYSLVASSDFNWTGTNIWSPDDILQFRMARIDGQNVWLSGGYTDAAPNVHVFRVGLRDSTVWPTVRYIGSSTDGRWGTNLISTTSATRDSVDAAGTPSTVSQPVNESGNSGPIGIHGLNANGEQKYFVMQNEVLSVVVGARSNPNTQGYIQVGLFKDHGGVDPRNGTYKVFASQRSSSRLTLDFDAGTYRMNEDFDQTSSGTFSADPADPGTYVFSSSRVSGIMNTARFRVAQDAIVGAFPFYVIPTVPFTYAVRPFVAARNFVTSRTELEGAYDVMVASVPAGVTSKIPVNLFRQVIAQDGRNAKICQLVPVTTCEDGSSSPYSVALGITSDSWLLYSGLSNMNFYVAKVGSRRLALYAFIQMYDNNTKVGSYMVAGLRQPSAGIAAWTSFAAHSYSGAGEPGTTLLNASSIATTYVLPNGTTMPFSLTLTSVANNAQVKTATDGGGTPYVAIQDGQFMFAMPTSGDSNQMHIGLADR